MKAAGERQIIRVLHLVLSIPIVGYLYGPVASIPQASRFTRWVAMPVVVLTGFWLWLKPRLLRWLRRRHSETLQEILLGLAILIALAPYAATAQTSTLRVGDVFPRLSSQTVTGRQLLLPNEAAGKTVLIIFTFGRVSGQDGQTWNRRLAADASSPIANYTIIFVESVPKMFQGRALSGIRDGMPQEMQDRAALMLQDEQKWRAALGVKDDHRAYLLLLGPDGRIVWENTSVFSESDYRLVRTRLATH